MNKTQRSLTALLALGLAGLAQAQTPTTPAAAPGAASTDPSAASTPHQREVLNSTTGSEGMMSGDEAGADPAAFVKKAAQGGMTEVQLGKLAQSKSQNPKIKSFADRMVKDHSKTNSELAGIAQGKGMDAPTSLDAEHQAMVTEMSQKSGSDFDAAYSKHMVMDHDKTIGLFKAASKNSDKDLAAFAKKTLPTLKEHKQMADALPGASRT